MEMILIISIMAYSAFGQPPGAGTFSAVKDGADIIRMDTRTGTMERCEVDGATVTCKPMTGAS
jgi:hypothetical protein